MGNSVQLNPSIVYDAGMTKRRLSKQKYESLSHIRKTNLNLENTNEVTQSRKIQMAAAGFTLCSVGKNLLLGGKQ